MPQIAPSALDRLLKADPAGAYLFYGEEEYLKRYWLNEFRKALVPEGPFSAFNHTVISGGDLSAFESALDSLPMLDFTGAGTGVRLVELRDTDFNKISKNDLEALTRLLSDVGRTAVIIYTLPSELSEGTKKKPSAALAALSGVCNAVCFERQSEEKLASWAARHFAALGCPVSREACAYLVGYCIPDMYAISGEIEKIANYALANHLQSVGPDVVRTVASPSRVYGAFDFSNAVTERDIPKALSVFAEMKKRRDKPEEIMGQISRVLNDMAFICALSSGGMNQGEIAVSLKMNEYAVGVKLRAATKYGEGELERLTALVLETDTAIKSEAVNKYFLIENLIFGLQKATEN